MAAFSATTNDWSVLLKKLKYVFLFFEIKKTYRVVVWNRVKVDSRRVLMNEEVFVIQWLTGLYTILYLLIRLNNINDDKENYNTIVLISFFFHCRKFYHIVDKIA